VVPAAKNKIRNTIGTGRLTIKKDSHGAQLNSFVIRSSAAPDFPDVV